LKYIELPDWIDTNHLPKIKNETNLFIFDGEMQKNYYGLSTLYEYGWGDIKTNILFIKDIIDLASKSGLNTFIKPKREIKSKRFEEYQTLLNKIQSGFYPNVFLLSSEVAVRKLCRNKGLVISKPFSTSGLIAREEFCESIYYDPLGNKFENDPGLRGMEVISNQDDLLKFFERKK
jgi:polysaccharide biosynthesis PFTS motif protein